MKNLDLNLPINEQRDAQIPTPNNNDGKIDSAEILREQGSDEQKMKEKYLSEVSKIEDAPGNGGDQEEGDGHKINREEI